MTQRRTICVVSGSRAEYGILRPVMEAIAADPSLRLQVAVTGMHLAPRFGETWREIAEDGFSIDEKVEMLLASDTPAAMAKSTALGLSGFVDALARLDPDIVLLLGDRFEILAAAQAAFFLGLPIAHIAGGDVTEGALDDAMRHCISKMARRHFVTAEPYGQRLARMGEDPAEIFVTGSPALDNILNRPLMAEAEMRRSCGLEARRPFFLLTYHPVTAGESAPEKEVAATAEALAAFPRHQVLITLSNADAGGAKVNAALRRWAEEEPGRVVCHASLGMERYLSAMAACEAVIGNSSSGIYEAPAFGKPTINIGPRQKGRLRAASVIDCAAEAADIRRAVGLALSAPFREKAQKAHSPYGDGHAAERIRELLKTMDIARRRPKAFFDPPDAPRVKLGELPET